MPWSAPVDPTTATVIAVAYAHDNIVVPITWLRNLTGNADPPGSAYVVVSTGPAGTAWGKVTTDVIADGAITPAKIAGAGFLPLSGGTLTGLLTVSAGGVDVLDGGLIVRSDGIIVQADGVRVAGGGVLIQNGGLDVTGGATLRDPLTFTGDTEGVRFSGGGRLNDRASPVRTELWAAGGRFAIFDDTLTTQLAELRATGTRLTIPDGGASIVGGITVPTGGVTVSAGGIIIANGGLTVTGPTTFHDEATFSTTGEGVRLSGGGRVRDMTGPTRTQIQGAGGPIYLTDALAGTFWAQFGLGGIGLTIPATGAVIGGGVNISSGGLAVHGPMTIDNTTLVSNLNAQFVSGRAASSSPGPNRIPISDAEGTLNSWVTGSGIGVPLNIVVLWGGAAGSYPSGWERETPLNGRYPVAAGQSSATPPTPFVHLENSGTAWTHTHTGGAHIHGATGLTFSGTAGTTGAGATNGLATAGGVNLPTDVHTHGFTPAGTIGGGTALAGNGATTADAWTIPSRAYEYIRKTS